MAALKCISFDEFVQGRDANVRVTDDGYLYAVDLVMVMTGKNQDDSGKVLRRLTDDLFSLSKIVEKAMPGNCLNTEAHMFYIYMSYSSFFGHFDR